MNSRLFVLSAALATLGLASPAVAVPHHSQVEGVLLSAGGGPAADGTYTVSFAYLDAGGASVWSENGVQIAVKNGSFASKLGAKTPLTPAVLAKAAQLTLQVGSDPPLPAAQVASVPLALRAGLAEELDCSGCIKAGHLDAALLQGLAKTSDLQAYAKASDLSGYAKTSELADYVKASSLAKVAGTGSYSDLKDLPALAKVATSGAFADLGNLPVLAKVGATCGTGLVMQGIKADGSYACVAGGADASSLPKDGLDEVSNGLLTNQFSENAPSLSAPLDIKDAFPAGTTDEIIVPDYGLAQGVQLTLDVSNSDISKLKISVFDPQGKAYVLHDQSGTGTAIKTSYPAPTKLVSGDLAGWVGQNPKGKWSIAVADLAGTVGGKDGKLNAWSIQVQTLSSAKVGVSGLLLLQRAAGAPQACTPAVAGGIYFDTTLASLRFCDGKLWRAINDTCGNGVVDAAEECDDGNNIDNDGCSANCIAAYGAAPSKPGKSCLDILTTLTAQGSSAKSGVFWLKPTAAAAFQAYCDMESNGGGYTVCATDSGEVHIGSEFKASAPYGQDGYRADCRDIAFSELLYVRHDNGQKAGFARVSGGKVTVSALGTKVGGGVLGEWKASFGVAKATTPYQLLICDGVWMWTGFFISGIEPAGCTKECGGWCNDTTSDYYRFDGDDGGSYNGVSFGENGHTNVSTKLMSVGIR